MSKKLKTDAENLAKERGFSSLQEFIRVALKSFVEKKEELNIFSFHKDEYVTEKMAKRYEKDIKQLKKDLKAGRTKVYTDSDELLAALEKGEYYTDGGSDKILSKKPKQKISSRK